MDSLMFKTFLPEIFLSFSILSQLLINSFLVTQSNAKFFILEKESFSQTSYILIILLILFFNSKLDGVFFNFLFFNGLGTYILKIFILFSAILVLVFVIQSFKSQSLNLFEFFTLYLFIVLSLLLLVSSVDMLSAYLVIEMQALILYILACFKRNSVYATEASLKYFILGSIFTALFLVGCTIIYLVLGTLNLFHLKVLFHFFYLVDFIYYSFFLKMAVLFITVSFFFKLAVAPFHFWAPDVYEGAPLASTIIFTLLPKIALFSFFIKWIFITLPVYPDLAEYLGIVGLLSTIYGSFLGLLQKRLKRFLIYSSIAQVGFLICSLSCVNEFSIVSTYYYLFIYIISSIAVWGCIVILTDSKKKISIFYKQPLAVVYLFELSNFVKIHPLWALSLFLFFFSSMGLPPLSGFFSKVFIFYSLINVNLFILTMAIVFVNLVASFYYLRLLKLVLFDSQKKVFKVIAAQTIVFTSFFYLICFVSILSILSLFVFFFDPSFIIIGCHFLAMSVTTFF